jgi:hypothetical protein
MVKEHMTIKVIQDLAMENSWEIMMNMTGKLLDFYKSDTII